MITCGAAARAQQEKHQPTAAGTDVTAQYGSEKAAGDGQLHLQDLPYTETRERRMVASTPANPTEGVSGHKPGEYSWMCGSSIF
jgi:hypothetical protein